MGRARLHQPQDRRLRHVPPLEGVRRRFARAGSAAARAAPRRRAGRRTRKPKSAASSKSRWNRWPSAASPRSRPSRSSCRRCARPSVRRWSMPTRTASARWCRGVVKRVDRNGIYVDLGGNAEGFVPRTDMIPREIVKTPGPHQGVPEGSALRAARPAAVPVAHRAANSSSSCSSSKCRKSARASSRSSAPRAIRACAPRSR